MLAVLAAAFAMVSVEQDDATETAKIVAYGETDGLAAIFYDDGKLLLNITASITAPNVDVSVIYSVSESQETAKFYNLTKGQTGILLVSSDAAANVTSIDKIEVFSHGTTTPAQVSITTAMTVVTGGASPIKFNLNESSLLASATDTTLEDVTFVRYAVMPVDKTIDGSLASFTKWQFADGTDVSASLTVEDFLFTYGMDTTLYAVWNTENVKYKVRFDLNTTGLDPAITGSPVAPADAVANYAATEITATAPVATNYTFKEWNSKADGTGDSYVPTSDKISVTGLHYKTDTAVPLYAIWEKTMVTITFNNDTEGSYYFTDTDNNAIYTAKVQVGQSISFKLIREDTFFEAGDVAITEPGSSGVDELTETSGTYTIAGVTKNHTVSFTNTPSVGAISFDPEWNVATGTANVYKVCISDGAQTPAPSTVVANVEASTFISYGSYGLLKITKTDLTNDYTYSIEAKATTGGTYAVATNITKVSPTTWKITNITAPTTLKIIAVAKGAAVLDQFFIDGIDNSGATGVVNVHVYDDIGHTFDGSAQGDKKITLAGTIYYNDGTNIWYMDAGQQSETNKVFDMHEVSTGNFEYAGSVTVTTNFHVYAAQAVWGSDETLTVTI